MTLEKSQVRHSQVPTLILAEKPTEISSTFLQVCEEEPPLDSEGSILNFLTIIYQLLWISGILKTGSLHSKVLDVVSLSTSLTICPTPWNRYHSGDILKRSAPEGITSDLRTILRYQIRTFLNFVKSLVHHSLVSYTILGVGYQIFHVFPFQYCSICKVNNLENSKEL